jgi:predicted transcriptional regulator
MIKKVSYAFKLSAGTRDRLRQFCEDRGTLQAHFVEQAILERLDREELLEDALEFKRWKHEEPHRMPYEDYMGTRVKKQAKAS